MENTKIITAAQWAAIEQAIRRIRYGRSSEHLGLVSAADQDALGIPRVDGETVALALMRCVRTYVPSGHDGAVCSDRPHHCHGCSASFASRWHS